MISGMKMNNVKTTILFMVRHGETEWNLIGKHQGHLDSPLTESGIKQAYALSDSLFGRGIEIIYSSDLGRAVQTAEIIGAKLGLKVNFNHQLRERHLGSIQGFTQKEFQRRYPREWETFDSGDPDYCFSGGESTRQCYERSITCVEELVQRHPGEKILVVAHGGVVNGLLYKVIGIPLCNPLRFSMFNAAINRFSVCDNSWRLDTWGEICHLKGMTTLDAN